MSVRNAILGLLAQQPRHGYELHSEFEALAGGEGIWEVKPAQIYMTLARLEDSGLIVQEGVKQGSGPEKRIYKITPEGLAELSRWYASGIEAEHQRDEFFIKLMLSLSSAGAKPRQVIQAQRSMLYKDLHNMTTRRSSCNPATELAQIFLMDKSIMHLEADLRWLDLLESRLDDIQKQPKAKPPVKPRGRPRKDLA
jgi:DNA-binding PadR family transcriptional regulator